LGEEKLGEIFRPLIKRNFEMNRGWFVGDRVPGVRVFYMDRHLLGRDRDGMVENRNGD
jgi:hypothetical protein